MATTTSKTYGRSRRDCYHSTFFLAVDKLVDAYGERSWLDGIRPVLLGPAVIVESVLSVDFGSDLFEQILRVEVLTDDRAHFFVRAHDR